jgi:mono/diheme cytochrome c family protein
MRLRLTVALASILALVPVAASAADEQAEPKPQELIVLIGRGYYREYCRSCHGADGVGNGPAARALARQPADLTRIAERRKGTFNSVEVAALIDGRIDIPAHGSREMPVWGSVFSKEAGDDSLGDEIVRGRLLMLVEYLRSIQRR